MWFGYGGTLIAVLRVALARAVLLDNLLSALVCPLSLSLRRFADCVIACRIATPRGSCRKNSCAGVS